MNLSEDRRGLSKVEHRALQSVAVQFFVNGAVLASYIPRLPEIRDALDLTLTSIGIILAVATGTGIVGSVVQAPLISRLGTKHAMTISSLVLVFGLAGIGLANSVVFLIIALAVVSISDVVTDVAMNMAGSALSARRSVPVINRLHGLWSVGTVVGGVISSLVASLGVPLRIHLIVAAVVLGFTLIYVASGLLATDEPMSGDDVGGKGGSSAGLVLVMFVALGAAAIVPEVISSDWAAFRLADDLGASNGAAGFGFVAFTSGMVIGRFSADYVVGRLGSAFVLRRATAVAAAGTAIAMFVPFIAVALLGLVITGLGVSVMFPQLYDTAAKSSLSGGALGGLTAGSRGALLVAPLVVGSLAGTDTFNVGSSVAVVTIPAAVIVLILSLRLTGATAEG